MVEEKVMELVKFRLAMKEDVTYSKAKSIWGKRVIEGLSPEVLKRLNRSRKGEVSQVVTEKISIAQKNIEFLKVSDWVKFVGISGSVAAGFAKEDDDIDLYIVVKNHTAWIYRGILTIRNLFNHVMRTNWDKENVKDLFCINFISEERGLEINNDIFNFHELMYMIPIDKRSEKYLPYILSKNSWLKDTFYISLPKVRYSLTFDVSFLIKGINLGAYISQLVFMFITGHKPELRRISDNYRVGRIEFFPKDFKKRILDRV
jgi:predicted nucleotidyltransferase